MQIIVERYETIIRKNNYYYNLIDGNTTSLVSNINYLCKEYGSVNLQFLFDDLLNQTDDIYFISSVIKNYSDVLLDVLATYRLLDKHIASQLDSETRKLL